jgi:hypothetical protein
MGAWDEFLSSVDDQYGREPAVDDLFATDVDDVITDQQQFPVSPLAEFEKRTQPSAAFLNEPRDGGAWDKFMGDVEAREANPPNDRVSSLWDIPGDFLKRMVTDASLATPEEMLGIDSLSKLAASPAVLRLMEKTEKQFNPQSTAGAIGGFVGATAKYITAAHLVGAIPAIQAEGLRASAAHAGIAGAMVRALKPTDDEPEDFINRIGESMKHYAYGYAVVGGLGLIGKGWLAARGGEGEYLKRISGKLHRVLMGRYGLTPQQATDAVQRMETTVNQLGGEKGLRSSAINRLKQGAKEVKNLEGLRKSVRITAFRKLGLKDEAYRKFNMGLTGKVSTKEMTSEDLKTMNKFYKALMKDGKGKPSEKMMSEMMSRFNPEKHFVPGVGAQARGVEGVFRDMGPGFEREYHKIYVADVNWKVKGNVGTKIMKKLSKQIPKNEKAAHFDFMESVETDMHYTPAQISKAFHTAAEAQGVPKHWVEPSIYLRRLTTKRIKEIHAMKIKTIRKLYPDKGLWPKMLEDELPHYNIAYQPNIYKRMLSARGGLSAAEFHALKKAHSGKVVDRFLFDRTGVSQAQKELLVKDAFHVTDIANKAALRTIHLEPVTRGLKARMNTPGTKIAGGVRKYVDDWLDYGVLGKLTPNDIRFKETFGFSSRVAAANLKATSYAGTMFWNPATLVKQLLQQELNVAELGKHWLKGVNSVVRSGSRNPLTSELVFKTARGNPIKTGMSGWEFAAKNSTLFKSRQFGVLEGLDPGNFGKVMNGLLKVGLYPFKLLDSTNIVAGFNGGVSKALREGKSMGQAIKFADALVRKTQYNYLNIETPLAFHGAGGKLAYQFMSWPVHYAELLWSWGGKMNYDGTTKAGRVAEHVVNITKSKQFARYFAINASLIAALNMAGVDFGLKKLVQGTTGMSLLPSGIPPSLGLMLGLGKTLIGGTKTAYNDNFYSRQLMNRGMNEVMRQVPIHTIPAYTQLRKIYKITQPGFLSEDAEKALGLKKELPWRSLLLPVSAREYDEMRNDLGL